MVGIFVLRISDNGGSTGGGGAEDKIEGGEAKGAGPEDEEADAEAVAVG